MRHYTAVTLNCDISPPTVARLSFPLDTISGPKLQNPRPARGLAGLDRAAQAGRSSRRLRPRESGKFKLSGGAVPLCSSVRARISSGLFAVLHIRLLAIAARNAPPRAGKSLKCSLDAAASARPLRSIAPVAWHAPVDGPHSIENTGDKLLVRSLDLNRRERKRTLVLWPLLKFTRLVPSPGLKLSHRPRSRGEKDGRQSKGL